MVLKRKLGSRHKHHRHGRSCRLREIAEGTDAVDFYLHFGRQRGEEIVHVVDGYHSVIPWRKPLNQMPASYSQAPPIATGANPARFHSRFPNDGTVGYNPPSLICRYVTDWSNRVRVETVSEKMAG